MLELLTTCPRALEYNKLHQRISSADKPSLNFGSAIHLALEYRYKTYRNAAPDLYCEEEQSNILTKFFNDHPAPIDDWRTLNWAIEVIKRYNQRWALEPFNLLVNDKDEPLVELSFALPLFTWNGKLNLEWGDANIPVIYTGRIDLPVKWDDQLFIGDHKTTGMLGKDFFGRMKMSAQQKGYCFSGDTELLTNEGWCRVDSLQQGMRLAQWEKGDVSFVNPTQYFIQEVDGNLIQHTGSVETLTTEDHRFLVKDRQSESFREYKADSIPLDFNHRLPCAGRYFNPFPTLKKEVLRLCAMIQADGNITEARSVRFHFKKDRKIHRCESNLNEFNIGFTKSKHSDGTTSFHVTSCNLLQEAITLLTLQKQWGWWLFNANFESLDCFLNEVMEWDGSDRGPKGFIYSTSSQNNAEWIQTISSLVERRASIHTQETEGKVQWRVNIADKSEIGLGGIERSIVPFKGKTYCVNVPSSWLMTKRNGVVVVAGNSWAWQELTKQKVTGYFINAIRTKEPPKWVNEGGTGRSGKVQSPEQWWQESLVRERYFLNPGELDEWKSNTIKLVEEFFWHYSNDYMPMKTAWCMVFGRCPYFDVCSLAKQDRGLMLSSGLFTKNEWSPLKQPTQSKQ